MDEASKSSTIWTWVLTIVIFLAVFGVVNFLLKIVLSVFVWVIVGAVALVITNTIVGKLKE